MNKTMKIDGMSCNHCKMSVEKALKAVNGVANAEVDLKKKQAVITLASEVDNAALTEAVKNAGFEPKEIK